MNAEKILIHLGALDSETKHITALGRSMAAFPVAPRYAKMLMVGKESDCLDYTIALVAALTVGDPFMREVGQGQMDELDADEDADEKENRKRAMSAFGQKQAVSVFWSIHFRCFRMGL
jgi:ATP-dependent RNA helicase DHX37/DHR1